MFSPAPLTRMPASIAPPIPPALVGGFPDPRFGSEELRRRKLDLVGGFFHGGRVENDTYGHFSGRSVNPGSGDETTPDQLIHGALVCPEKVAALAGHNVHSRVA